MNKKTAITVKKISHRTEISLTAIHNYGQNLECAGELITERQGKGKKSENLNMWLTEGAIYATYDQILTCLPKNNKGRLFTLLEEKFNREE